MIIARFKSVVHTYRVVIDKYTELPIHSIIYIYIYTHTIRNNPFLLATTQPSQKTGHVDTLSTIGNKPSGCM